MPAVVAVTETVRHWEEWGLIYDIIHERNWQCSNKKEQLTPFFTSFWEAILWIECRGVVIIWGRFRRPNISRINMPHLRPSSTGQEVAMPESRSKETPKKFAFLRVFKCKGYFKGNYNKYWSDKNVHMMWNNEKLHLTAVSQHSTFTSWRHFLFCRF